MITQISLIIFFNFILWATFQIFIIFIYVFCWLNHHPVKNKTHPRQLKLSRVTTDLNLVNDSDNVTFVTDMGK